MAQPIAHRQPSFIGDLSATLRRGDLSTSMRVWWHRHHSRQQLLLLNAQQLADIGLDRYAAQQEADKPFWVA